ncbi:MAG: flippase-like domain-containing protein [Bacilli bacterium]|nr:flippase-like domain-containing protein [Bacilli bacterium]
MDIKKSPTETPGTKDSHKKVKYIIYILIVFVATGISLWLSLKDNFQGTLQALVSSDWRYVLLMIGIVFLSYLVDGLIIFVFCRLYTRRYRFHQGLATSLVGQFYSDVTPGASGGQVMQIYTLRSQGVVVSNAASIMVMWFILYQSALLIYDVVAFIVEREAILKLTVVIPGLEGLGEISMIPLIIAGFLLNVSVILLLFTMSFWHGFHNFVLHYVVGFLAKIKLVKKPDVTRENLRAQVENFKIELKRLSSNIPVVVLNLILFTILLFCRLSIPYFAGMAMDAWGDAADGFSFHMMMDASFLGAFHQMVTGLLPIPGAAGVSELFYTLLFPSYFKEYNGVTSTNINNLSVVLSSTQILWRIVTFHVPLVVSGFTAAFYRSRHNQPLQSANRKTFVALTMSTMTERSATADTMYETTQMSRRALQQKLLNLKTGRLKNPLAKNEDKDGGAKPVRPASTKAKPVKEKPVKEKKRIFKSRKKIKDNEEWESWDV